MDVYQIIRDVTKKNVPKKSIHAKDWLSWYRGKVRGFHNYRIYNGENYLELERKTMQMAKHICETWANLLLNERCDIILPDADKKVLNPILTNTNFWVKANDGVEKSFALGIGALVLSVSDIEIGENTGMVRPTKETSVNIDFVNETKIIPITIKNKEVTECAFYSVNDDGQNIVLHVKQEGTYKIHNYNLDKDGKLINRYIFDTKYDKPLFWIIRPNISNNIITELTDEELGISIFANSIDTLKAIDNKYDGFDWEYVLGRKRMFIASEAWKINKTDGETVKTFDPYDTLFYQLPETPDGKPVLNEMNGELRFQAYIEAINQELNILSMKCGLGETYFKFDGSNVATATQIVSENSTLYRNIKKHEIILEKALIEMTKAIIHVSNAFTPYKFSQSAMDKITIKFDDSIIEDKNTEMERDRLDVTQGLMAKYEYRMKWYGEDEKTAKQKASENFLYENIDKYMNGLTNGGITPELYVENVFPNLDEAKKNELIAYIEEFIAKPEPVDPFNSDEVPPEEEVEEDDGTGEAEED